MGIHTQHLDSLAGLMQLSSAAVAADAVNTANSSCSSNATNSNESSSSASPAADVSLPIGWQRIIHSSGLPCYVHDGLGIVCWTRPYPLGVGGLEAMSQSELHRLVKQHVPPLSIFAPTSDVAAQRRKRTSATDSSASMAVITREPKSAQSKKRKLNAVMKEDKDRSMQQLMTLEEFKTLSIGDPRVLQACMELSIKTPAQVLQEYQNRNRGVSISYNTVPVEDDGVMLFKTIVTAGSTVAEGVASTKKIAKQLGAQQLLAILHERKAQSYYEVANMYNNSLKGQPVIAESSMYGPTRSLRNDARSGRSDGDPRVHHRGSSVSNQMRRARQSPPNKEHEVGRGYRDYDINRRGTAPCPHWGPYHQQPMQSAIPWNGGGQQGDCGVDNTYPERVVVYSNTSTDSGGNYSDGQFYNSGCVGGNAWGNYQNVLHPTQATLTGIYSQHYSERYAEAQPPPENRL